MADFRFCTEFLKEISKKIEIGRKWVSEYSKFSKLCLLGIETTLKNSNNYLGYFRDFLAKTLFFQFLRGLLKEIGIWPLQGESVVVGIFPSRGLLTL